MKEDLTVILMNGINLKEFDFDQRVLMVFVKALTQNLSGKFSGVRREGTNIYYEGPIFLLIDETALQFRLSRGYLYEVSSGGRFVIETIKFVHAAAMDLVPLNRHDKKPEMKIEEPQVDEDSSSDEESSSEMWL